MGRLIYKFDWLQRLDAHRRSGSHFWARTKTLLFVFGIAVVLATTAGASSWRARAHAQSEQTTVTLLLQVVSLLVQIEQNTRSANSSQP